MSKTAFDDVFRMALWNTYHFKCFYCTQPLDWVEMEIDHLVPESLETQPVRLNELVVQLSLEPSFHVNIPYNLVPAHAKCNLRKSGTVLEPQALLFYLQLSKEKLDSLNQNIAQFKSRKNKGVIISKLQSAFATNLISLDEMTKLIDKAKRDQWISKPIILPHEIDFIDGVFTSFYLNENYDWLYEKALPDVWVELTDDQGELKHPANLREWIEATDIGFYPKTNADIKNSSTFLFLESFMKVLGEARMPKLSFISNPWITLNDLDFLSPRLIFDPEQGLGEYIANGASVGDLVRMGIVKLNTPERYQVNLEYNWMETSMHEQFRADFKGDGIEGIFVKGWCRAIGGTLGFAFTSILTRYSNNHLIEEQVKGG